MGRATIHAGICGFVTDVRAASADRRHVTLKVRTTCPDVAKLVKTLEGETWDAFVEIGPCAQPGSMYETRLMGVCGALPHVACPVPAGIAKAIEVAAGLALPQDARIEVAAEPREEPEEASS